MDKNRPLISKHILREYLMLHLMFVVLQMHTPELDLITRGSKTPT